MGVGLTVPESRRLTTNATSPGRGSIARPQQAAIKSQFIPEDIPFGGRPLIPPPGPDM